MQSTKHRLAAGIWVFYFRQIAQGGEDQWRVFRSCLPFLLYDARFIPSHDRDSGLVRTTARPSGLPYSAASIGAASCSAKIGRPTSSSSAPTSALSANSSRPENAEYLRS